MNENKQTIEERLHEMEERFRSLFERSLQVVFISDLKGKITEANPYALKITGYDIEDIKHLNFSSFLDLESVGRALSIVAQIVKNGVQSEPAEFHLKKKDGSYVWLEITSSLLYKEGKPHAILGVGRDITERKNAEKALQTSEERYRQLFSAMIDGFALHEMIYDSSGNPSDYRFLEINPSFESMTGLKAANVIGKTVKQILPQTEKYWIDTYGQVASSGKSIRFENFSKELNKYFEVVAFSPQKGQFATIFVDVSEKRLSDQKLRDSIEESKKMLEAMTGRELKMVELKNEIAALKKTIEVLSAKK